MKKQLNPQLAHELAKASSLSKVLLIPQLVVLAVFLLDKYGAVLLAASGAKGLPAFFTELVALGAAWPMLSVTVALASLLLYQYEQRAVLYRQVAEGFPRFAASELAAAGALLERGERKVSQLGFVWAVLLFVVGGATAYHVRIVLALGGPERDISWVMVTAIFGAVCVAIYADSGSGTLLRMVAQARAECWKRGPELKSRLDAARRDGRLDDKDVVLAVDEYLADSSDEAKVDPLAAAAQ